MRMFGAALQAAEAALDAAPAAAPKREGVVSKPPGGRSFPDLASDWVSSWNFGKASVGRLGARAARGRMDADESAAEMASRTSDDRIANVGGVGVERETGGERKTTKLGSAAGISTHPHHTRPSISSM